jgi:hypothetical protein
MKVTLDRIPILKEITKLTETHCKRCEVTEMINTRKGTMKFCIEECQIGKEFQRLGKLLAIKKKGKIVIKDERKKRVEKVRYPHITREMFEAELATGKSYKEIEISLGIGKQCTKHLFTKFRMEGRFGANYQSIASFGVHQTRDS